MKSKFVLRCVAACMALSVVTAGLCSCSNENQDKVKASDNLLASVQKSEDAPGYDFNNAAQKPEGYDNYITKTSNIALQLLKQTNYSKENTITAPVPVALSLSALENAANKNTLKQVKSFLGKNTQTAEEINQNATYLSQRISFFNTDDTGVFNVNSMWISNELSPKRSFLQKVENYYNMYAYKTDFGVENTNTVITNLISDNSNSILNADSIKLESDYKMYLDSSTAVSDCWLKPYDDSSVKTDSFTKADGSKINATYLTSAERTFKTDKAQGFVKDLKNISCKLVCIMPNEDISLETYINELTAEQFLDMPLGVSPTGFTSVSIPEFSITKSGSIKEDIKNIGIDGIFDKDADFSKGFSEDIFVNDFSQTVSITVNKNGISTKNVNNHELEKQNTNDSLVFNRPFIYAVVDNESYAPIIMGTVNNPQG